MGASCTRQITRKRLGSRWLPSQGRAWGVHRTTGQGRNAAFRRSVPHPHGVWWIRPGQRRRSPVLTRDSADDSNRDRPVSPIHGCYGSAGFRCRAATGARSHRHPSKRSNHHCLLIVVHLHRPTLIPRVVDVSTMLAERVDEPPRGRVVYVVANTRTPSTRRFAPLVQTQGSESPGLSEPFPVRVIPEYTEPFPVRVIQIHNGIGNVPNRESI